MAFPKSPATGKNGKVLVNSSDGQLLNLTAMTKQASYVYNGKTYANQIYLLGTGKTLINMRPEKEPEIFIAGIVDGLEVAGTASNDEVAVSAGTILNDSGTSVTVAADASVAVTRPAVTEGAWVAISVNKSTGAFTATKGTDTASGTGIAALLDTYGSAAGERPLIPVADLLVALLKLTNGAAPVVVTEIFSDDREEANVDAEVLPNIGGARLSQALVALHVGALSRPVTFTGYYLDNVMSEISTAKGFSFSPSTNDVTDSTMFRNISISEVSGWSFSFDQLMTDAKAWNNVKVREGYGAVRLQTSNGHYWQGVATMSPSFTSATGALNSIAVAGSFLDAPEEGDA